ARAVPDLPRGQRPAARRAGWRGGGAARQSRLDLRDRDRGRRGRARRLRRPLARGRPGGGPGAPVVRAAPARPGGRRPVTAPRHSFAPPTPVIRLISISAPTGSPARLIGGNNPRSISLPLSSIGTAGAV